MEILLLGHMGRDEALVDRLSEHRVHVIGQWHNPGLAQKAIESGGSFHEIDDITNVDRVIEVASAVRPGLFLTNFDDSLAAGVVDGLQVQVEKGELPEILIPCPNQDAARIEWDKFYLREIVESIDPKYNPENFMAVNQAEVEEALSHFRLSGKEIALKPRNLTGGKGVKVMGKHFDTFEDAREYCLQVLESSDQDGIEIQEKIEGHEFTLQIFTDGKEIVLPPVTYDYPYREDGDEGPGTGGMGTFSMKDGRLPFVDEEDYQEVIQLSQKILEELKIRGIDYKGVFYPSFFKTQDGLKVVEVNARGGDPELINILDLLEDDVNLGKILTQIATGELDPREIRFKEAASAMIYLVSPDYGYAKGPTYEYYLDPNIVTANDTRIRFAATEKISDSKFGRSRYKTVGSSRSVGLSAIGETPWEAREKILSAVCEGFSSELPLHFRRDVADRHYIRGLSRK